MKSFVLGITFFSFFQVFAQNKTEEKEVLKTIEKLFDGMRKSDSTMVRNTFHSSARLQTAFFNKENKSILMTSSINDFVKSVGTPHSEIYDERIISYKINIDENLATVWTEYAFYVGAKFSHCGVNAFQLFKTEEGWKIIQVTDTRRKEGCKKKW
jgi:hypothetical protein